MEVDWSKVEKLFNKNLTESLEMAIIESEKILRNVLEEKRIPGKTIDKKIEVLKPFLSNHDKLVYAQRIYKRILREPGFEIDQKEVESILQAFYQAVTDLTGEEAVQISPWDRIRLWVDLLIPHPKKFAKKVGLGTLGFFLFVLFLSDTLAGRKLVQGIVNVTHFIFSWVILAVLIALGIIVVIVISVLYFESRRTRIRIKDK